MLKIIYNEQSNYEGNSLNKTEEKLINGFRDLDKSHQLLVLTMVSSYLPPDNTPNSIFGLKHTNHL